MLTRIAKDRRRGAPATICAAVVVALCLAIALTASAVMLPKPQGANAEAASSGAGYQGLLVGSGSSGAQITQLDVSSGSQQSISPSEFDSLTAVAFAPGSNTAYIAARGSDNDAYTELIPVTVSDSGPVEGTPIPIPNADYPGGAPQVSPHPSAIAVAPDEQTAYVVDEFNGVVFPVEDLGSGTPTVGAAISGFYSPTSAAVSADGSTVYVLDDNGVNLIDAPTGAITSTIPIPTGTPASMALSPDGKTAYVTSFTSGAGGSEKLYAIKLSSETASLVATLAFSGSDGAQAIAITPDGETAYVEGAPALDSSDQTAAQVAPVDLRTDTVGTTIDLGAATTGEAYGISITPDGRTVFATESCTSSSGGICQNAGSAYPIATATDTAGAPISVMGTPLAAAITPDQPPVPSFTVTPENPGSATQFDASASTVAYGTITNYAWNFGDGSPVENTTEPTVSHAYASGGYYTATLTETDSAGSTAETTRTVTIASPPVPTFGASASAIAFGLQQVGSISAAQSVTITNTGDAALTVSSVSIGGAQPGAFAIAADGCAGQMLAGGASCSVAVDFSPAGAGAASAALEFSDDAHGAPQSVALSGTGATASATTTTPPGTLSAPATPSNGTGTLYGLAGPTGVAVTLYRASSSVPVYEGAEEHVFAYSGASHVESYGPVGEYEISGISPGTYKVEGFSFATGAVNSISEVTISANQVTRDDVELSHGSGFTGGLSVATGFGSEGPLPMAIVGIPFQLSVPLKVTSEAANTIVNERYTLSFGPQTTIAGEASTATYDVLVYYNAKGTPLFISGHEARAPAPTSTYGSWNLSQASAGLTTAQPLAAAADAASRGGDPGPDVFNGEMTPLVADGGTMNVNVGIDMSYFPPPNETREAHGEQEDEYAEDCPAGTHPEKHTTGESLDPEEQAQQQTTIDELSEQLTYVKDTLRENEGSAPDQPPHEADGEEGSGAFPAPEREPLSEEEQVELEQTQSRLEMTLSELKLVRTFFECVPDPDAQPSGSIYVDPSGKVTSSRGVPIANAKVTLLRSTTAKGKFTPPAKGSTLMSPSNRRNPDFTDPLGLFGWDVEPGYYKVSASARGCYASHDKKHATVSTKVFEVPPPVTQIRLELTCPRLKRAAAKIRLSTKKNSQTVTVKVSGRRHGPAYGMVTVKLGGRRLATLPLEDAEALVLVRGNGKLMVSYSGDGHYAPATGHLDIDRAKRRGEG
jgi:DNA-binding beta-propeller fold protein YncE